MVTMAVTTLTISKADADAIRQHAQSGFPEEVCGFIFGQEASGHKTGRGLKAIANGWDAPDGAERESRFAIPPDEYAQADREGRARGEDILGFYHSHPNAPAAPSGYDLTLARQVFPGYSYIIVSVRGGIPGEMTCWVLRDDGSQFDREPLIVEGEGIEQ